MYTTIPEVPKALAIALIGAINADMSAVGHTTLYYRQTSFSPGVVDVIGDAIALAEFTTRRRIASMAPPADNS